MLGTNQRVVFKLPLPLNKRLLVEEELTRVGLDRTDAHLVSTLETELSGPGYTRITADRIQRMRQWCHPCQGMSLSSKTFNVREGAVTLDIATFYGDTTREEALNFWRA